MRSSRLAGGLAVLLIGVMFLLANAGYLDMGVWALLGRMWPALLILAGISLLIGRSFRWFLVGVLILVIVMGTFGGPFIYGWATGPLTTATFAAPGDVADLTSLTVDLALDVPSIRLAQPSASTLAMTLAYRGADEPQFSYTETAGVGRVSLTQRARSQVNVLGGHGARQNLELTLPRAVPIDLLISVGVVSAEMDLGALNVRSLSIDGGVSNLNLRMGQPGGATQVSINSGVTNLKMEVPNGVGLRVVAEMGVGSRQFTNTRLRQSGNVWEDDLYATAENRLEVRVTAGVGRFELTRY